MIVPPEIEALPNGQWIVAADTHLGAWARQHGSIVTDPCLFRFLHPFLQGVRTVWDIGANIGDHTRQYLDWGMDVVAVEPDPLAFLCLKHNCPAARCYNAAASEAPDALRFRRLENVGASRIDPAGDILVPAIAMDLEWLPVPGFVKIDVEGWEPQAMRGMERTLKRYKPLVFVEINKGALEANGHTDKSVTDILTGLGYEDFTIYPAGAAWGDPQFDILAKPPRA